MHIKHSFTGTGGLLFGHFLLAAQEKVTRLSCAAAGGREKYPMSRSDS